VGLLKDDDESVVLMG